MLDQNGDSGPPNVSLGYATEWDNSIFNNPSWGYSYSYTPTVGSIAQWEGSDSAPWNNPGRVAYVERVDGDTIAVSEDNILIGAGGTPVFRWRSIHRNDGDWPKRFLHITDPAPVSQQSFQSDTYADIALFHKNGGDAAFNAHILYGSGATPFQYNPTFASAFPASSGWDWSKVKLSSGDYDGDGFTDVTILHQTGDGGANIYFIKGYGGTPLQYTSTVVRSLPASSGWDWSKMTLESGKYKSSSYADLAILHQLSDGGFEAHILYGASGTPFQTTSNPANFSGSSGWDWTKIKTSTGDYDADGYSDISVVHQVTGDGSHVHMLKGSSSAPFTNSSTYVKSLPTTSGWFWSKMKLASGLFQSDAYADLVIVQQRTSSDAGFDVHVQYGGSTPFTVADTSVSSYPGSSGWDWSKIKLAAGKYDSGAYSDIAFLHQTGDGGANTYVIWGSGGTPLTTYSLPRSLPGSSGWVWNDMRVTSSQQN